MYISEKGTNKVLSVVKYCIKQHCGNNAGCDNCELAKLGIRKDDRPCVWYIWNYLSNIVDSVGVDKLPSYIEGLGTTWMSNEKYPMFAFCYNEKTHLVKVYKVNDVSEVVYDYFVNNSEDFEKSVLSFNFDTLNGKILYAVEIKGLKFLWYRNSLTINVVDNDDFRSRDTITIFLPQGKKYADYKQFYDCVTQYVRDNGLVL